MKPAAAKALLDALPRRLAFDIGAALDHVAEAAAEEARRLLGDAGARPSRPGEPPADAGGSLAATVVCARTDDGAVQIAVSAPFAADLEFGTRHMAARPFLRPAVANIGGSARAHMAEVLSGAVAAVGDESA